MTSMGARLVLVGIVQLTFVMVRVDSSIFVADNKMEKMIELNARRPHCRLHTDRGDIQSTMLNTDPSKVRQVPVETVRTLEKVCSEGNLLTSEIQGGLSFIYPGTLWCGPGNIAKNYSDLGRFAEEDKCCRAHDNCFPQIAPGECLKSICNHGTFTRLHCDCDEKFRNCLSALNSETGNTLGAAFFNAIQVTCFDARRPCSNLQRNCQFAFYPERRFAFHQAQRHPQQFSDNSITAEARIAGPEHEQQRSLDPQTLQLFFTAFYNNFIQRPLRGLGNFFIVTKTIVFAPNTVIEEKVGFNETEQEEICSRFKFRPSAKFRSRIIKYKSSHQV